MGLLDAPNAKLGSVLDPISAKIKNPFNTAIKQGGLKGPDFPEGFRFIEIIDGRESADADSLVILRGNMLPEVPFRFGGTQRLVKEYYPGNPEPTTQVMGARENDLVVKGRLKSKHFRDVELYGAVSALQEQIDLIRIKGNLLRIWLGEWQRYGFLEESNFDIHKLSDIHYELKFSIVGFRIPSNNKFALKDKSLPIDVNTSLIAEAQSFQETYSAVPTSMPRSIAETLNAAISDVATAINLVTNFVDTTISTAEDIVASANRAIGLIKNAKTKLSQFKRRIGGIAHGFSSLSSSTTTAATQFKDAYNSSDHLLKSLSATITLADFLARLQKQFAAIAKTTPIGRYRTKDGDTLQRISIRFYNNADNWKVIYDHNKLTTTQLVVGTVLEIPHL